VILQKENDCKKSLSQQEKNPQKEGKEEQGSKGKEVKPHLPIQGHEKLHEKKEDEKFNTNGRDLKRK
jgi:hypothetical protein